MTLFLVIGVLGIIIVLLSILLGDIVDGLFDLDFLGGDLFSLASIAAFLGAFGFGGVISLSILNVTWIATVVGLAAGILAAWGATSFTRWLKRSETQSTFTSTSMVGSSARVITDIPAGGFGEVRVLGSGQSRKRAARSDVPLLAGTEVWVSAIVSPTAVEVTPSRAMPESPGHPEIM
ncbi:MAG: NfeD family protein [Arachnia sp.]